MDFDQLDEVAAEYHLSSGGKDGWYQMQTGENRVRIVSGFEVLSKHFLQKGTPPVVCIGPKNGCVQCINQTKWEQEHQNDEDKSKKNPLKPSTKFLMWVIDRRDGKLKIAEFGWSIIEAIGNLKKLSDYAFNPTSKLPDYDIIVTKTVTGKNISDTKYSVNGARQNTPLTEEEAAEVGKLTSIKQVVDRIREKVKEEYRAMDMEKETVDIVEGVERDGGADLAEALGIEQPDATSPEGE